MDETDPGADIDVPAEAPQPRKRRVALLAAAAVVVVGLGVGVGVGLTGGSPSAPLGPEGVPLQQVPDLASAGSTANGQPVDGMTCRKTMEQTVGYHIHAHLDIFVNGQQRRIPAGAGIASRTPMQLTSGLFVDNSISGCLYWLHVHANDGIIHIEAPVKKTFTLGQFFDVWHQPLGPDQVGPAKGTVTAFENGKQWTGNPRDIPLLSQADIQLDVGTPVVPFQPLTFHVIGICSSNSFRCGG